MPQKLITKAIAGKLISNWDKDGDITPPVAKIFSPVGGATWLLLCAKPEDPDIMFGLCDLGMGEPELGYVSLAELKAIRVPVRVRFGNENRKLGELPLERDLYFEATHPLMVYWQAAKDAGRIIEYPDKLKAAAAKLAESAGD